MFCKAYTGNPTLNQIVQFTFDYLYDYDIKVKNSYFHS